MRGWTPSARVFLQNERQSFALYQSFSHLHQNQSVGIRGFFEFRSLDGRSEDCLGLIKVRDAKAKSHLAHFRVRNVQFGISLHQDCTIKSIAAFLKSSADRLKS